MYSIIKRRPIRQPGFLGSVTDSLTALERLAFAEGDMTLPELVAILDADFEGHETLRQRLAHRMPKYGNDDDRADRLMTRTFTSVLGMIDGRPDARGGCYRLEMLPTTNWG